MQRRPFGALHQSLPALEPCASRKPCRHGRIHFTPEPARCDERATLRNRPLEECGDRFPSRRFGSQERQVRKGRQG